MADQIPDGSGGDISPEHLEVLLNIEKQVAPAQTTNNQKALYPVR